MGEITGTIAVVLIFGMPFVVWIVHRVLAHTERMEAIRRGMMPPPDPHEMRMYARMSRKFGGPPPGWTPGAVPPFYLQEQQMQRRVRSGLTMVAVGFALVVGLSFAGYRNGGSFTPGPWMLGGLIPLFIGLSQLAYCYLMGGLRIGSQATSFGPPPPGAQQAAPPPASGAYETAPPPPPGPYAWRPGNTPEIESPLRPPETR